MSSIFNPFSKNEVVGVVARPEADEIADEARDAGFEVEILCGSDDADAIDVGGEDTGTFGKVMRFFQEGEEKDTLRTFAERLRSGDVVVRILGVDDRADEAGEILARHGGESVWHYGRWTYTRIADQA